MSKKIENATLIIIATLVFSFLYFIPIAFLTVLDLEISQMSFTIFTAFLLIFSILGTYFVERFVDKKLRFKNYLTITGVIILGLTISNLARYLAQGEPSVVYGTLIFFLMFSVIHEVFNNE